MIGRRLGIVIILMTAFFLTHCNKDTEADKVKKVIISVQKAAEQKDIKEVLSHVEKNYRDPQGNDYTAIKNLLLFYFFRHQSISVYLTNLEAAAEGQSASARFQAVLSSRAQETGNVLPESLGLYLFDVTLVKDSGRWTVISASWERLGDAPAGIPNSGK